MITPMPLPSNIPIVQLLQSGRCIDLGIVGLLSYVDADHKDGTYDVIVWDALSGGPAGPYRLARNDFVELRRRQ